MNFLSHYYLHHDDRDDHFTVGLTLPDVIGIYSRRARVSEKYLRRQNYESMEYRFRAMAAGMIMHFRIDHWFHSHRFFKEGVDFLQENCRKISGATYSSFHSHILLEILIDRYLLINQPGIADCFYNTYLRYNFYDIVYLFYHAKRFNSAQFIIYAKNFSYSTFLKEYLHFEKIELFLDSLSHKVGYFTASNPEDDSMAIVKFFADSYEHLKEPIKELLAEGKKLPFNKEEIIRSL